MAKPKNIGKQIKDLRALGKTYKEIVKILNCNEGTVYYHLSSKHRKKKTEYSYKYKQKHPYLSKLMTFLKKKEYYGQNCFNHKNIRDIYYRKLQKFLLKNKISMTETTITVQDVINKFGIEPVCYLTGDKIDIYKTNTYSFDHKKPASKGGGSNIDNLGICTKEANQAKADKTPEEFFELCKKILNYNKIAL